MQYRLPGSSQRTWGVLMTPHVVGRSLGVARVRCNKGECEEIHQSIMPYICRRPSMSSHLLGLSKTFPSWVILIAPSLVDLSKINIICRRRRYKLTYKSWDGRHLPYLMLVSSIGGFWGKKLACCRRHSFALLENLSTTSTAFYTVVPGSQCLVRGQKSWRSWSAVNELLELICHRNRDKSTQTKRERQRPHPADNHSDKRVSSRVERIRKIVKRDTRAEYAPKLGSNVCWFSTSI